MVCKSFKLTKEYATSEESGQPFRAPFLTQCQFTRAIPAQSRRRLGLGGARLTVPTPSLNKCLQWAYRRQAALFLLIDFLDDRPLSRTCRGPSGHRPRTVAAL